MGQSDTRVACRALDDGAPWLDEALLLGVLDEVQRRSVLDRSSGGHELSLGEDVAAGLVGEAVEPDLR